jgi:HAE1 family hydrophobic/amphiphilic exporter-1
LSLASFGVRKPVVANLIMLAIIGAGVVFGVNLRREFFPEVRPSQVQIAAPYPGAAPEEVEEALAQKIEDAIEDVDAVVEVNSTVSEGLASILVEFEDGIDIDVGGRRRSSARSTRCRICPTTRTGSSVSKFEPNLPAIILNLSSATRPERELKKAAIREIRDDLRSLDGMGDLQLGGVRRDEIAVEVRRRLRASSTG